MEPTPHPKTNDVPRIDPCRHMETYLSALSDGSLTGPARWFTRLHLLYCMRCRAALVALQALLRRLRKLGDTPTYKASSTLTEDRRSSLDNALDEIDRNHP